MAQERANNTQEPNVDGLVPEISFKMDSSSVLSSIISSLLFEKKDMIANVSFNNAGIRISVDKARSMQARAYIKKESLQDYELLADHVQITINLSLMYRCLTVFGDKSAHVEFLYRGDGFPITFILEDQGVITECQINTLEPVSLPDFNFRSSSVINRAIIKSSLLKEALSDMDIPGSQYIDITMSPVHPFIKLASNAGAMRSEVQFLNDPEVFPVLACQTTASFPYALPLFRSTVKALSMATQTNIKMNTEGMLLLQHSIKSLENTNIKNWIEFTLSPAIMERDAVDLQR